MRIPPAKPPAVPGEWQEEVNQYGGVRRFRMVGNIKEYEMDVTVDGMTMPQSQVAEYHRRKQEAEQARIEAAKNAPPPQPQRVCPFKQGLTTHCRDDCALHTAHGCALVYMIDRKPATSTEGRSCPFHTTNCNKDCAIYNNGCIFAAI